MAASSSSPVGDRLGCLARPGAILAPCWAIARFRGRSWWVQVPCWRGPRASVPPPRGRSRSGPYPRPTTETHRRGHCGRRDPRRDHHQPTRVRSASSKTRISSVDRHSPAGVKSKRRRYRDALTLGNTLRPGAKEYSPPVELAARHSMANQARRSPSRKTPPGRARPSWPLSAAGHRRGRLHPVRGRGSQPVLPVSSRYERASVLASATTEK